MYVNVNVNVIVNDFVCFFVCLIQEYFQTNLSQEGKKKRRVMERKINRSFTRCVDEISPFIPFAFLYLLPSFSFPFFSLFHFFLLFYTTKRIALEFFFYSQLSPFFFFFVLVTLFLSSMFFFSLFKSRN